MARFEKSNQSVVRFCEDEGVSVPSFYQWRKKLDANRSDARSGASSRPSSGDREPLRQRFMPVQLLRGAGDQAASPTIVRLGGGIEIELGSDLTIVEAVIRQLTTTAIDTVAQGQRSQGVSGTEGGASC
jgi:hypothetical protein